MNIEQPKSSRTDLCTIRIAFPVESDEQAIELKKKLSAALGDVPQARLEFSIMTVNR